MSLITLFEYLRKSSESEEKQELSIPAQKRELTALAERRSLKVKGVPIEESMSAKSPGRPLFDQMIADLKAGHATGILCWKLDRLARNPLDGGIIIWLLGIGVIKEIHTPGRVYTGSAEDKMLMSIEFGMATKYSDDLSVNVRRGNREALEQGRWPGYPKLGYVRDPKSHLLMADPVRFQQLEQAWRLLLNGGTPPLTILERARREWGLTTPAFGKNGGMLLSRATMYRMFRDEFYAGTMVRAGERFPGTHPPMVTHAEFEAAQAILDGRTQSTPKSKALFFPYRGLARCGTCNAVATARYLTNRYGSRYTYYHCYRKERRYSYCPESAVQEGAIEQAIQAVLDDLVMPPRWTAALLKLLEQLRETQGERLEAVQARLAGRLAEINAKNERLRRHLLNEVISPEDYQTDKRALENERGVLTEEVQKASDPSSYLEPWQSAAEWLNQGPFYLKDGEANEKRDLANRVTWNLLLRDKKVLVQAKPTFAVLREWRRFPTVRAWRDYVETRIVGGSPSERETITPSVKMIL